MAELSQGASAARSTHTFAAPAPTAPIRDPLFERFVRPPDFLAELATGSPIRVQRALTRKWQVRRCYVNRRGQPTEAHVYTFYSEADAREVAGDLVRRIQAKQAMASSV
jgi:hypothetical protein